ncbi:MAG TPA: hypothetical protein VF292_07405 [Rhodanobacteraceae bacterium]
MTTPADPIIVAYHLAEHPDVPLMALGGAGDSFSDVEHALRLRYGKRVLSVRPYVPTNDVKTEVPAPDAAPTQPATQPKLARNTPTLDLPF